MTTEPETPKLTDCEEPPARPRHGLWLLATLAVLLVLGSICTVKLRNALYHTPPLTAAFTYEVQHGATLTSVLNDLHNQGLIPDAWTLRIYARLTGKGRRLKAGVYEVAPEKPHRPIDILEMLSKGRANTFRITFPEGKWVSEDANTVQTFWPNTADQFVQETKNVAGWRAEVTYPLPGDSLEGYLFPDTYTFSPEDNVHKVVGTMLKTFGEKCAAAYTADKPTDGRTLQQVLILASLVEAEARVPSERAHIAGVYMNRLKKKMRLECDATVVYAVGPVKGGRLTHVTDVNLKVNSPFNTYTHDGLPPAPICSPGLDSFQAALHPMTTDDLYYVAKNDGSGTHIFSATLAEHDAAQKHIRKGR